MPRLRGGRYPVRVTNSKKSEHFSSDFFVVNVFFANQSPQSVGYMSFGLSISVSLHISVQGRSAHRPAFLGACALCDEYLNEVVKKAEKLQTNPAQALEKKVVLWYHIV